MCCGVVVMCLCVCVCGGGGGVLYIFFFNDTATTEIYTLSLHDALPICQKPSTNNKLKETVEEVAATVPREMIHGGKYQEALTGLPDGKRRPL